MSKVFKLAYCSIASQIVHPKLYKSLQHLWDKLKSHLKSQGNKSGVKKVLYIRGKVWDLYEKTWMMGILNVTPDSFSDGGLYVSNPVNRALELMDSGADIVDIGGMSTRPGSEPVPLKEEMDRCIPVIKEIRKINSDIVLSIDTYRSEVAMEAVKEGADLINDISGGLNDSNMFQTMADVNVPVVIMHIRGSTIF